MRIPLQAVLLALLSTGTATGQNLVQNGTFSTYPEPKGVNTNLPAGTDLGGWKSGLIYSGTDVYAADDKVAVQTGPANYAFGRVLQGTFPGDPAYNVPASATWLYTNGNSSGAPLVLWTQSVVVQPNTDYAFSCYTSNAIAAGLSDPINPLLQFFVDNVQVGPSFDIPDEIKPSSGHNGVDLWDRREVRFQTGATTTRVELKLVDAILGNVGDDLALTAISLRAATVTAASKPAQLAVGIFPNPAAAQARLDLRALPAGPYQVTLSDALGRTLRSETRMGGEAPRELDLGQLPKATYLVRISNEKTSVVKRLVKQ